jgi:polar amino acid transport system substrate-binding protein
VADAPVLQYYVAHNGAGVAEIASPIFHFEDYGIAFPLGSDLRKQADDALLSIRENGDYDLIKAKWLGIGES